MRRAMAATPHTIGMQCDEGDTSATASIAVQIEHIACRLLWASFGYGEAL